MDTLNLLPFLNTSSTPFALIPIEQLHSALSLRRESTPLASNTGGKRQKRGLDLGSSKLDEENAEQLALREGLKALKPEWVNEGWWGLRKEVLSGGSEGFRSPAELMLGKGKGRAMLSSDRRTPGGSAIGMAVDIQHEDAFSHFSQQDQQTLLTRLLDILSDSSSTTDQQQGSYFSTPRTPLLLNSNSISLTPTLLPTNGAGGGYFVLMASPASLPSPGSAPTTPSGGQLLYTNPLPHQSPKSELPPGRTVFTPKLPMRLGRKWLGATTVADPELTSYLNSIAGCGELGRLICDYDWGSTPLGPIASWSSELKSLVSYMLSSPFRQCIIYGESQTLLYNDQYIGAAGDKHPELLGKTGKEGWKEIWDELDPVVQRVMDGDTVHFIDHPLPMQRKGYLEETYHTFAYSPFRSTSGVPLGILNISFETTSKVLAERRHSTVRELVEKTAWSRSVGEFCRNVKEALEENEWDLPFWGLWTSGVAKEKEKNEMMATGRGGGNLKEKWKAKAKLTLTLRESLGIPTTHPFAPSSVSLELPETPPSMSSSTSRLSSLSTSSDHTAMDTSPTGPPPFVWPFDEALATLEPVFLPTLPSSLTSTLIPRGWPGEIPRHAVVLPIVTDLGQKVPSGMLVVGVNTRGEYDELYRGFLAMVGHQIGSGLMVVTNAEADAKREADLIALDRAKTSFFSSISHELRTPLTLVLGPLEDILSGKEHRIDGNTREMLSIVKRHANRLLGMVNKLLDFSSLEGGRMNLTYHPVQLGALTRDLCSLFRDAIRRANIEYEVICEDDPADVLPVYLSIDLWEKIIHNLVGNSFKYCEKGKISVILRSSRAEAVLEVKDTGVGIPKEELDKIFERFHRVNTSARSTTGTGIGLALTLEVVKLLGGQLEVDSEFGVGSTFTVRLPRGFVHLPKAQVVHHPEGVDVVSRPNRRNTAAVEEITSWRGGGGGGNAETASISEESSASSSSGSGGNSSAEDFLSSADLLNFKDSVILLADDSQDLRVYITSILSKAFKVVAVSDGQAALEYCQKHRVSLVVSDIMMPRLDGRGLLRELRAHPSTSLIPIIFLSAQAGVEARSEALESGADDYLVKPFQARELLARVNVHLQLGRMRAELERRVQERTKALGESEVRYRKLADRYSTLSLLSPVGIFMTDATGHMTYANPRWYEIASHALDKPLAEWRDTVLPEDLSKVDALWASVLSSPLDKVADHLELRFKDGTSVQYELRAFYDVRSQDGFVGCITDITSQKRIEALHIHAMEQRANDAEENRRQQEQYIDLASHELRNPLSAIWQNSETVSISLSHISDFLEDLQNGELPDKDTLADLQEEMRENMEGLSSILLCASHQGRIADDILNVSKLNMGLLSLTQAPFDVVAKLTEILKMWEIECSQKGISLSMSIGASISELRAQQIVADASRVTQVLLNFLTNSIKFTSSSSRRKIVVHYDAFDRAPPHPEGGKRIAQPESLELPPGHIWASLSVEDTGKGLTQVELSKLFARFSQANPRSDQFGGTGLGLYISKKIIELFGGFIEVLSTPGEGSTFRFCIPAELYSGESTGMPLQSPDPASSALIPTQLPRPASSPRSMSDRSQKSAKMDDNGLVLTHVLVVEDNHINQKVCSDDQALFLPRRMC
ncbi:hypothetical protein T439DRAFT_93583 [Meredithblackwellia eburnea MCA 4105]